MKWRLLLMIVLAVTSTCTCAQSPIPQKIGHADWQFIFSQMPEYKQIESDLKTYEAQLQNQLKAKHSEFEEKYQTFQGLPPNTPEAIRKDKESELVYLQSTMEKFEQDARAAIQKRQSDLMAPVFQRVGKAIEAVAIENGYSYIINPQMLDGGDTLLFADERYNISTLVLKKLGVYTVK